MGKVTNLLLFTSVMMLLFYFAGITEDTPISFLLNLLLAPESLRNSSFYTAIAAALTLITTAGVVIGLFVAQKTEMVIKVGIITYLILMGWDMIVIFQKISEVNYAFATLAISPFLILYLLAVIEWWGGHD